MTFQDTDFKADPCTNMPWGLVFIGGSGRCLLSYPKSPSSTTVLDIRVQRGYQYTVLLFGLSLTLHTFMKCKDAALSLRRQMGIRIIKCLDNWLMLARSEEELITHRSLLATSSVIPLGQLHMRPL